MKQSLLSLILEHFLGYKYYIVILKDLTGNNLPHYNFVSSYIFLSMKDAQTFVDTNAQLASKSARALSISSFRSKLQLISNYHPNRHLDYSKFND